MYNKMIDKMIKAAEYALSVVVCALVMNIWLW